MILHTLPLSAPSRKVLAVIRQTGLPVTVIEHELAELRSPEFRAINPNGMVPVLVDGDETLWESNAIMIRLAERAPGSALFPAGHRLEVLRWLFWESIHFNRALGTLAFETRIRAALGLGAPDERAIESGLQGVERFAPVLEGHLAGRRYAVGETLTIADFALAAFEPYRADLPVDWAAYPNISAYFDRIAALDAWRQALGATTPERVAA